MATLEKAFEVAVVISAVDHLTPAMLKASESMKLARKNIDMATKSMKMMGSSSGEIGKVTSQLKNLEKQKALANLVKDMKDAGASSASIMTVAAGFEKLSQQQEKLDKLSASYDKFKKTALTGAGVTAIGGGMADGLLKAFESAGEFQTKLTVIQDVTGATTKQMNDLGNSIMDVSTQVTKFNDMQLAGFAQQLSSGGFNKVSDVQSLLLPVSQFAEAQVYEGKQSDPTEAVKQAIEMAHTFQHYDPKSFTGFLDTFNKYSNMQPGSSSDLYQTLQYLAPVASRQMKMKESDVMALAALDNRIGLTGSHGGTNAADMILRLIPGLIGGTTPKVTKDKQGNVISTTYPKALQAMMDLGLADAQGNSKFFKNGQITDLGSMLQTLVTATKSKSPEKITQDYKDIFGIQGGRAASLLADPTSIEQMQGMADQLKQTKSMEQIQQDINKTPEGQLNLLKSNATTALLRFAQTLAPALLPVVERMNSLLQIVLNFEKQHPGLMKVAGVFAVMATGAALVAGPMLGLLGLLGMARTGLMAFGVTNGFGGMFGVLGKSLTGVLGPLGLAASASYLLYDAWTTNFGGIQQKTQSVIDWIKKELPKLKSTVDPILQTLGIEKQTPVSKPEKAGNKILGYDDVTMQKSFQIPGWVKPAAEFLLARKALGFISKPTKAIAGFSKSIFGDTSQVYKYQRSLGGSRTGSIVQTSKFFAKRGLLSTARGVGRVAEGAGRFILGDLPVDAIKKVGGWGGKLAKGSFNLGAKGVSKGFGALKQLHQSQAIPYYASQGLDMAKGIGGKAITGITSAGKAIATLSVSAAKATVEFGKLGLQAGIATAKFLANAASTIAVKTAQTAASLATKIWSVTMIAFNAIMDANPIALIILAVAGLITVVVLMVTHWKTVITVIQQVWDWMKRFAVDIGGVFSALWHDAESWGTNIVMGIWNGINNMWGWLKNNISKWIVDVIPKPIAKALGLASPSKLMKQYGAYTAQGLAIGMTNNSHLVSKASTGLASSATDGMQGIGRDYSLTRPSAKGNGPYYDQSLNIQSGAIVIHQQPGQDAKALAREVYQELGRLLRNDGRRSGAKPRNAW